MFLVRAIATSVPTAAGYRVRTTPAVIAPERAESRGDPAAISRPASTPGLVAAVPAGHHRIAEFVRRQALTVVTSERTLGTFSSIVAADFVLAARTVAVAIAEARPRYADVAIVASERLQRAAVAGAFLVGTVGAIGAAVTDEEPADAAARRSALERARRAAGPPRVATAIRWETAVAHAVDAT